MARILVIDDDQSICELICEIIESEGHTTQYCQDALTALDLYAREQPDLIVCDFSMPGMDGAELFIEVNGYQKSCPFIFISGYTEKINLGENYTLIKKPVHKEELLQEINRALNPASSGAQPVPGSSRGRVLVAQTDQEKTAELGECLRQFGYEAVLCRDGKQVLRVLKGGDTYQLIIADTRLPGMGGLELLEKIHADAGLQDIPVMIIADITEHTIAEKALELGAVDFLSRPYNKLNLEFHLRKVFEVFQRPPAKAGGQQYFHILLVESGNDGVMESLIRYCTVGHRLSRCFNAGEALELMGRDEPDIVVIDHNLPGQSGLTLTRTLHMNHPGKPCIVLTAGDEELALEAVKAGAFAWLDKPVRFQLLQNHLQRAMDDLRLRSRVADARDRAMEAERLAAVGTMSATFAHEIANPVAIISGHSSFIGTVLQGSAVAKEDPRVLQSVEKIQNATMRVARLIRSLGNLSRSQFDPERGDETVGDIIEDASGLCEYKMGKYGITWVRKDENLDCLVHCNRVDISQVLVNLITNACHAVEDRPKKEITVSVQVRTGEVAINVSDTGSGIAPDIRERIFEPFFTTKPVGKGTGLGLSTCRRIVESYGGRLDFTSTDQGTTFTLILARVAASGKAAS